MATILEKDADVFLHSQVEFCFHAYFISSQPKLHMTRNINLALVIPFYLSNNGGEAHETGKLVVGAAGPDIITQKEEQTPPHLGYPRKM